MSGEAGEGTPEGDEHGESDATETSSDPADRNGGAADRNGGAADRVGGGPGETPADGGTDDSAFDDPAAVRERLARQRARLETLRRVNDVVREVGRVAVRATGRDELETAVCERLTGPDRYAFAWVGETDPTGSAVVPRASGGAGEGFLDAVSTPLDDDRHGPTRRAVETRSVQVASDLEKDLTVDPWRDAALDRGFRSMAAVPLVYEGARYGLLSLYADATDAFEGRERAVLAELGETIGLALGALEKRRALLADTVVEVEFALHEHPLAAACAEVDATMQLAGTVGGPDDEHVFYYAVDGDPAAVADAVADRVSGVRRTRVVDEGLVEFVVAEPRVTGHLVAHGGAVTRVAVEPERTSITAQFPPGTDVRAVLSGLPTDVDLTAQRTTDPSTAPDRDFGQRVTDRLTDRQRMALRTAYFAGYHDRPRTSAGTDVAETLDVAPSTFHQHHRVGVRKLLAAAFDTADDVPE